MSIGPADREEELLFDLVRCYSPSGSERPAVELLVERLSSWGWTARVDEVGNFIGQIGEGSPTICFLGHIDTVEGEIPVGTEGRRLYGRGAVDAKGPLAAAACAATRLIGRVDKKIIVVGAVEEETRTSRGARHIANQIQPDFAIIGEPSHWDRITIGYKGILHYRYTLRSPRAHGAAEMPSPATVAAASFFAIAAAHGADETAKSPFERLTANIRSFQTESGEFSETATMAIDLRVPPSIDPAALERQVREGAGNATVEVLEKLPAVRCDKNNPLVRALLGAIRRQGGQPRFALKTGTSDMNIVVPIWRCPAVAYGPGDSKLDHTPQEHVDLDEYKRAIAVLETAFQSL